MPAGVDFRRVIRFTLAEMDEGKKSDVHSIAILCAEFEAGTISRWRMTLTGDSCKTSRESKSVTSDGWIHVLSERS